MFSAYRSASLHAPYAPLTLGKAPLPFFCQGDPATGEAVRGLAGRRSAVMLADHGPVKSGEKDFEAACYAVEEPEEAVKLALLLRGMPARCRSPDQILAAVTKSEVDRNA